MKKSLTVLVSSALVLGCMFPACAAPKHLYTDADSGFTVLSADPLMEYASKYSYGFQKKEKKTDSLNSLVAIPAEINKATSLLPSIFFIILTSETLIPLLCFCLN